jgi:hypothetical protein
MKGISGPEVDFTSFEGYLAALNWWRPDARRPHAHARGHDQGHGVVRNVKMAGLITFTPTSPRLALPT